MQAFLESEEKLLPSFDVETRLDYFKYCIHDVEEREERHLALLHILMASDVGAGKEHD